jgi:hypothetical protein
LLVLATLLLSTGSVAAWAHAHSGYRHVVYYWHAELRSPLAKDSGTFDEWIDPARHWSRTFERIPQGNTTWLFRDGLAYCLDRQGVPSSPQPEDASQVRMDNLLRLQGFAGFNQYWLSRADGPIRRVLLAGRVALQFSVAPATAGQADLTVWLDAGTHDLLRREWLGLDGVPETLIYSQFARLDPGTLPVDFFTPLQDRRSLWDEGLTWLRQHLGTR